MPTRQQKVIKKQINVDKRPRVWYYAFRKHKLVTAKQIQETKRKEARGCRKPGCTDTVTVTRAVRWSW